jgi:hypothetical protein
LTGGVESDKIREVGVPSGARRLFTASVQSGARSFAMRTGRLLSCSVIVALGLFATSQAFAQRTGGAGGGNNQFGSSGMTSGSGGMFGSASSLSSGGLGGGNTGFGSSAGSGTGFGVGGGNTGFGTGQSQQGRSAQGFGQQGNTGFLGANNNTNNFLGRNNQGQQQGNFNNNQFGQGRGGGGGQRGLDQQLLNMLNGGGQGGGGNNQNSQNTGVRPRQKIAFEHPTRQAPTVAKGVETRFSKMTGRHAYLKSLEVAAGDDGAVVLRGTVDSEHAALLAESLVRLEPGVKTVRNELTYPPPAAAE